MYSIPRWNVVVPPFRSKLLICLFILGLLCPGVAVSDVLWQSDTEVIDLAGKMSVFRDIGGLMSPQEVMSPSHANNFQPLDGPLMAGFNLDTFWLRFDVTSAIPTDALLEVEVPYLQHVTLFSPTASGTFTERTLGIRHPFAERPIDFRTMVFPVDLKQGAQQTYYLRIITSSIKVVRVHLWQPTKFMGSASKDYLYMGLLHGATLLMVLFALVQYILSRETTFGALTLYVATFELAFAGANGFISQFLLPHSPHLAEIIYRSSLLIYILVASLCGASVLRLSQWAP